MLVPSPIEQLVDQPTAAELLRIVVPHWQGLLDDLESTGGRLAFRDEFSEVIERMKIDNYPQLYENPAAVGALLAVAFFGVDGAKAFDKEACGATPAQRGKAMLEFASNLDVLDAAFDFDKTPDNRAYEQAAFDALPAEERDKHIRFTQHLLMGIFALFFETLSVMVHGERLSALVARAKSGDEHAFLKAIQIDKRILTKLEFFERRFQRAHTDRNPRFAKAIARKQEAPPYVGKLTHKKLWLAFALLDSIGLLESYGGNALLDLCVETGVIDDASPVEDVKNLLKLKTRYRAFQKQGAKSTP